jgi:peptidoglycan hydrolase CwlO-like protein
MSDGVSSIVIEEGTPATEPQPGSKEETPNSSESTMTEQANGQEPRTNPDPGSVDPIEQLKEDNALLQEHAVKLEQLLAEANAMIQVYENQQKDLEKMLEEKSDVIRELHLKVQEAHNQPQQAREEAATAEQDAPRSNGPLPQENELLALSEELEKERQQLKEDEETLMQQMRDMEIQMSRERAELARQRNDLQRLHGEIRHELELATRQGALRERLEPLQRRYQDMVHRQGGEPSRESAAAGSAVRPVPKPAPAPEPPVKESGILRRLFG